MKEIWLLFVEAAKLLEGKRKSSNEPGKNNIVTETCEVARHVTTGVP